MRSRLLSAANATESPHPRPGDVCIGCVHQPNPHNAHYFYLGVGADGIRFKSGTGRAGIASWMLLCDACFMKHGGHIKEDLDKDLVQIGCDMVWPDDLQVRFQEKS